MPVADARELLRRFGLRVTPQRRAIIEAFRGGDAEHLSADEVHSRASAVVPEVGRGTVYATLAELTELGLLASVGSPEPVRYESNLTAHDHFRCRLCLRMFDVELGGRRLAARPLPGFAVEAVSVVAEGICEQCRDYQRGLDAGAAAIVQTPMLPEDALADLACARVDSPLGELALAASAHGIVRLAFAEHADFDGLAARARGRRGPGAARVRLAELAESVQGYFGGAHDAFPEIVDWRLSTTEAAETLTAVALIPYAAALSYEHLRSGLSSLDRGHAMGANPVPLLVPCHRVTRGSDRPEVYVGGVERLHLLRALESR